MLLRGGTITSPACMDPQIAAHLVTLDPEREDQRDLCQRVVEETYNYLHRPALDKDRLLRRVADEYGCLFEYCNHVNSQLRRRLQHLDRLALSNGQLQLRRALDDWSARSTALQELSCSCDPLYFSCLEELEQDLAAASRNGLAGSAVPTVAVLVCHFYHLQRSACMFT